MKEVSETIQIPFEGAINGEFTSEEKALFNINGLIVENIEILNAKDGLVLATFRKTESYTENSRSNLEKGMK